MLIYLFFFTIKTFFKKKIYEKILCKIFEKTGICMSSIFSNISGKYKKTKLGIWKLKN